MSLERPQNECQINLPHACAYQPENLIKIGRENSEIFRRIYQFLPTISNIKICYLVIFVTTELKFTNHRQTDTDIVA